METTRRNPCFFNAIPLLAPIVHKEGKQYQGGLTERLREMVTERAESVDKAITAVHVSDEEDVVMKISQLREKLKSDDVTFQQLQTQVLDIGSSITGGGSPQIAQPQSSTGT